MVITISGTAGSGTTTIASQLATKLNLRYVNAGMIMRDLAKQHDLTIVEFGEYIKDHPETDHEVDDRAVQEAKKGNVILEGRLSGYMIWHAGIQAVKVLLKVDRAHQVQRIAARDHISEKQASRQIEEREQTNWERYGKLYGIDHDDEAWYDLVIDTSEMGVAEIVELVMWEVKG